MRRVLYNLAFVALIVGYAFPVTSLAQQQAYQDYTTDYANFPIGVNQFSLNTSASSSIVKTNSYWELSVIGQSVAGGLGIGTRFGWQPDINRVTSILVDWEIISNTTGSGCNFGWHNGSGSNANGFPARTTPGAGAVARATTTYNITSATSITVHSFGLSRATTCNGVIRVYRISDQTGATIWSPVTVATSTPSTGTSTKITVNLDTSSTTNAIEDLNTTNQTIFLIVLWFLVLFSVIRIVNIFNKKYE